ncbi:hypothetical protein ADUPG1_013129 [Aduncisulcus paluster]|uniref:Enkurin domain-containing protein n=1 Tax=Aduncisulcus paluster TaxID=2918883 RepID=A0ABQ5K1U8_9EUKA|nr:hypothetical protein ADUPG1_013129 [Aduncisulcus paluster]
MYFCVDFTFDRNSTNIMATPPRTAQEIISGPVNERAAMRRKGEKPKDHMRSNKKIIETIQKKKKTELEAVKMAEAKPFKISKFQGTQSKIRASVEKEVEECKLREELLRRKKIKESMEKPVPSYLKGTTQPIKPPQKSNKSITKQPVPSHIELQQKYHEDMLRLKGRGPRSFIKENTRAATSSKPPSSQPLAKQQSHVPKSSIPINPLPKQHTLGSMPDYLVERKMEFSKKRELEEARKAEIELRKHVPPGCRIVADSEKKTILETLKQRRDDALERLVRFPSVVDSISKRKERSALEKRISDLDKAIGDFSKPLVKFNTMSKIEDSIEEDFLEKEDVVAEEANDGDGLDDVEETEGVGMFGSTFNIINSIVGTGVLAIPAAFNSAGIIDGCIGMALAGVYTLISYNQLVICSARSKKYSYKELAVECFGPGVGLWHDLFMFLLVFSFCCAYLVFVGEFLSTQFSLFISDESSWAWLLDKNKILFSFCCAYLVFVGEFLSTQFSLFISDESSWAWLLDKNKIRAVVLFGVMFPITCLTNINFLSYPSAGAVFCVIYSTIYVIVKCVSTIIKDGVSDKVFLASFNVESFNVIVTILMSIGAHFSIPILYGSMGGTDKSKVSKMKKANAISISFCLFCYLSMALSGNLAFGSDIQENILLTFDSNDTFNIIAQYAMSFVIITSYPLTLWPVRMSFYTFVDEIKYRRQRKQELLRIRQESAAKELEKQVTGKSSATKMNLFSTRSPVEDVEGAIDNELTEPLSDDTDTAFSPSEMYPESYKVNSGMSRALVLTTPFFTKYHSHNHGADDADVPELYRQTEEKRPYWLHLVVGFTICVMTLGIAIALPSVLSIFNLFGSTFGCVIYFLLPAVFWIKLRDYRNGKHVHADANGKPPRLGLDDIFRKGNGFSLILFTIGPMLDFTVFISTLSNLINNGL